MYACVEHDVIESTKDEHDVCDKTGKHDGWMNN